MIRSFYQLPLYARLLAGIVISIICAVGIQFFFGHIFAALHNLEYDGYTRRLIEASQLLHNKNYIREALLLQSIVVFLVPAVVLLYSYSSRPFQLIARLPRKYAYFTVYFVLLM
ncbi:MAG: hypothetical protein R6U95_09060, partial [Bacteroidales bacterium]